MVAKVTAMENGKEGHKEDFAYSISRNSDSIPCGL
jgi:hypothetical protein